MKAKMHRKGVLGLDTVRTVMVFLLFLAVVTIALFLGLTNITTTTILPAKVVDQDANGFLNFQNDTITLIDNSTGARPSTLGTLIGVTLSDVVIHNATGVSNATHSNLITAGNYTIVDGFIFSTADAGIWNNTRVNVTAGYSHQINSDGLNVQNNITTGATTFFSNIPTVFTILGAVVIILAVTLILFAVRRFGSGNQTI